MAAIKTVSESFIPNFFGEGDDIFLVRRERARFMVQPFSIMAYILSLNYFYLFCLSNDSRGLYYKNILYYGHMTVYKEIIAVKISPFFIYL